MRSLHLQDRGQGRGRGWRRGRDGDGDGDGLFSVAVGLPGEKALTRCGVVEEAACGRSTDPGDVPLLYAGSWPALVTVRDFDPVDVGPL